TRNIRANLDAGEGNPDKTAPVAYLVREGAGEAPKRSQANDVVPYTTEWPKDENGELITIGKMFANRQAQIARKRDAFAGIGPLVTDEQQEEYNREVRERLGEDTSNDPPQKTRHNRETGER